jgi:hypothetical protein
MTLERGELGPREVWYRREVRFGLVWFGLVWFGTMSIPGSFVTSSSTEPPPAAAHPPPRMHR